MNDSTPGWGIVGPGAIAAVFAEGMSAAGAGRVARVYGRDSARRAAFCGRHGGRPAASLEELCADPEVELVYVASPHPAHHAAARSALEAGKAVLCEKPLTTSLAQTTELIELARERGLPLLEAYMYRAHPQLTRLLERVGAGEIGRPLRSEASFTFIAPDDPSHRLLAPELGGGGILDVGGYPVSFALALAASCGESATPILSDLHGEFGPTGVDVEASCVLHFANGLEGHARVCFTEELSMRARVIGEQGSLELEQPFMPEGRRDGRVGVLLHERDGQTTREEVGADADCFGLEARELVRLLASARAGERDLDPRAPMVTHAESLRLAELLEAWRRGLNH